VGWKSCGIIDETDLQLYCQAASVMESLLEWVEPQAPLRLFVLLILCSCGFPFSKVLALILAGVLVSRGSSPLALALAGTLGLHLGDALHFTLGRLLGVQIFEWRLFRRLLPKQRQQAALALVERRGVLTLFIARITPFLRTACYLAMGSLGVRPLLFHSINLLVSAVYAGGFLLFGWVLGANLEEVERWGLLGHALLGSTALLGLAWFLLRAWNRQRQTALADLGSSLES
jgi:membrane protein DedA with SNARE-associated domain